MNEPFDDKWKTRCRERIDQASVTICLIGEKTWSRDAVVWELETSYELKKKVFGIRIYRDKSHYIPQPLIDNHAPILYWNIADIVAELNK